MTNKDCEAAVNALLRWLESQDLTLADAGIVLGEAIVSIITGVAERGGADPLEGGRAITEGIMRSIDAHS